MFALPTQTLNRRETNCFISYEMVIYQKKENNKFISLWNIKTSKRKVQKEQQAPRKYF